MIFRPKPAVISVAYNLPEEERAWSCPLCSAALPSLSVWDRQRAIRKHIEKCHPGETLQSLYDRRRKSFLKPGVREHNHKRYAKAKKRKHKTHDIVTVIAPERDAKGRAAPNHGRSYYCTRRLAKIGRHPEASKTCAVRQRDFRQNEHTQCMRRRWWTKLKQQEPGHAKNYASAMKKTFAELDKFYGISS